MLGAPGPLGQAHQHEPGPEEDRQGPGQGTVERDPAGSGDERTPDIANKPDAAAPEQQDDRHISRPAETPERRRAGRRARRRRQAGFVGEGRRTCPGSPATNPRGAVPSMTIRSVGSMSIRRADDLTELALANGFSSSLSRCLCESDRAKDERPHAFFDLAPGISQPCMPIRSVRGALVLFARHSPTPKPRR